jgi:hypothetical protein
VTSGAAPRLVVPGAPFWALLWALLWPLMGADRAAAVPAPQLGWRTIATPCCDVHYAEAQADEAQRVAAIVDECVDNATRLLQGQLQDRLQVVIHDVTDSANGFANSVPYNRVELRTVTPDDTSELGRTEDWLRLLVQHEVLHIAHLDVVHGLPAIVNVVIGKSWPPNIVQPRMFVEGLAVWAETRFTDAGRLRATTFSTPLRLAALQGDRWSLDDAANASRRPPGGGAAYMYGAFFVDWLTRKYGAQLWAAYAHDYGGRAIPYAVQRSLESITGRDLALDWADFLDDARADAERLAAITRARGGPTPARRLTRVGGALRRPAFLADGTLIVAANPPDGATGLYAIRGLPAAVPVLSPVLRTTDLADVTVVDDLIVFSQSEVHRQWFGFRDLFVREADGRVRQLTDGARLRNPAAIPGTRLVVAEQRSGARSALVTVDVDSGTITDLAVAAPGEIYFTPQVSPDGRRVVVSRLDRRGERGIAILERATGRWQRLVNVDTDRSSDDDRGPAWGLGAASLRMGALDPVWLDDDTVAFAADDDGVFQIVAVTLSTGARRRLVDTLGSASLPTPTPDGRGLLYAETHLDGLDLWATSSSSGGQPLSPLRVLEGLPVAPRAVATTTSSSTSSASPLPSQPYTPWPTLWPRTWRPEVAGDPLQGMSLGLAVDGTDAAELYTWTMAAAVDTVVARPGAAGSLRLRDLPLPLTLQLEWRPLALARGRSNDGNLELHVEDQLRASAALTVPLRRRRFTHSVSVGTQRVHAFNGTGVTSSPDSLPPDYPNTVRVPVQQAFTLDWFYGATEQYRDSVSTEWGLSASARLRFADRLLFSDVDIREVFVDVRAFQPVPGLGNHVVAAYLTGGATFDDRPGSLFFLGGFVNRSLLDDLLTGRRSAGGTLRGFPIGHVVGDGLAALTLEYRLPLLEIERGLETLPVFVDRLHGAVFVDSAAAFDTRPTTAAFATGVGAELRLQVTLGYYGSYLVRAGYARGLTSGGVDQPYVVLGLPY